MKEFDNMFANNGKSIFEQMVEINRLAQKILQPIIQKGKEKKVSEPQDYCIHCHGTNLTPDEDMNLWWCNDCEDFAEELTDRWDWEEDTKMNERIR